MSERALVLGHSGLVGSAICRALGGTQHQFQRENDLRDPAMVAKAFDLLKPTQVYLAAAKVGGIGANSSAPADFIRDNLLIQTNVIHACHQHGAKLLFLGSSCIYPRMAEQPIGESALGTGALEPTNEAYAWAKLAGIAMVKAYRQQHGLRAVCLMPTNLYGPGDNFDPETSHLVPALIAKMHAAKVRGDAEITLWGTGSPRRELLHVDDLAAACIHLINRDLPEDWDTLNIGTGEDLTVREIADRVAEAVGYQGRIGWDPSRPDGTPRKMLDVGRALALGWRAKIGLRQGLEETYAWYLSREKT